MVTAIRNSWELVKASARVLQADKELVIFPIISAIGTLIVSLAFIVPFFFSSLFDSLVGGSFQVVGFLVLFLFYVVQYVVIFFANTALVGAALIRIRGGDPTIGDGFRIAASRIVPILGYAVIAATVGMLLRALSNQKNGLGRLIASLIGLGWNLATFLVVPILAIEDVGPIEAVKRSVNLLKRTWGEQLIGNMGMQAVITVFVLGVILVAAGGLFLAIAVFESIALAVAVGVFLLVGLLLIALAGSTLNGIYTAALYQYAVNGQAGTFFDETIIRNAFRSRSGATLSGLPIGS